MAKELPYFKFEPSEWENGNIQMCSRESKGLFIDLCSIYWSRLGELPYALALQKLCNGNELALQELIKHEIICFISDQIVIQFLDEQLSERGQISVKRRESAEKRWKDANALQKQSKSNAKRIEEKRKEESKKDEKPPQKFSDDYYQSKEQAFEEIKQDDLYMDEVHRLLTGKGWRVATKVHALKILKKFLIGKADLETDKKNVRQHFKNYLFSQPVSNLVQIADEG